MAIASLIIGAFEGPSMSGETTIRLKSEEKAPFSDHASAFGRSTSEFMRRAALDRIEDELDLVAWWEAKAELDADPQALSVDDIAEGRLRHVEAQVCQEG